MTMEIKFRAIAQFNGTIGSNKMIEGQNIRYQKSGDTFDVYINGQRCIPETVGQFTGLYDINGEPIYENDIVKWSLSIDVVHWDEDGYFVGEWVPGNLSEFNRECKVIGNIHEHSHLLEAQKL